MAENTFQISLEIDAIAVGAKNESGGMNEVRRMEPESSAFFWLQFKLVDLTLVWKLFQGR